MILCGVGRTASHLPNIVMYSPASKGPVTSRLWDTSQPDERDSGFKSSRLFEEPPPPTITIISRPALASPPGATLFDQLSPPLKWDWRGFIILIHYLLSLWIPFCYPFAAAPPPRHHPSLHSLSSPIMNLPTSWKLINQVRWRLMYSSPVFIFFLRIHLPLAPTTGKKSFRAWETSETLTFCFRRECTPFIYNKVIIYI